MQRRLVLAFSLAMACLAVPVTAQESSPVAP